MMTMHLRKLRFVLQAMLVSSLLAFGLPSTAFAQDEDEDGDNVLESDEVSGDEEEEDEGTTTIVVKDTDPSAVVIFRDRLSPYGSWVDHPSYGTVWVPSSAVVGDDFAPYVSSGHWELTEDGDWLWVSDYEWGYIPFHYGRWVWVSDIGWAWIPGRVYAPAWVVWRTGAHGYIGWAPMPPAYYWHDGVAVTLWVVPPAAYVFCHGHHVFHHHVHHHVIHDHDEVRRAASHTKPYKPATPKKASSGGHKPAQPTIKEAGVPRKSVPKNYGKDDPKATSFMKPGTRGIPSGGASSGSAASSKGSAASRGSAKSSGGSRADRGSARSSSKSLGVSRAPTKRGSFSSSAPPSRGSAKADRGSRSAPPSEASTSDAPRSKKATKSRPSKDSSSSSSSSADRSPPPSSKPSNRSGASRPSAPPSAGGGSRKSRPSVQPPPSSVKRAAPSRGRGRGRR